MDWDALGAGFLKSTLDEGTIAYGKMGVVATVRRYQSYQEKEVLSEALECTNRK